MQANKLRRVVSSAIAVSVFLVVAAIALFGTFFIAALWHACPPYERIQHGMTKQEVRYILGHSAHREPIGGQGDWMVPRKLPAEEGEEKELWSTGRAFVKIAYDNRGKVVYLAVRNLNHPR